MAKTTNTRFQILCKLLECGAGGGNRTIRAYSFYVTYCKHTNARTAKPAVCPPPMYKIMYNEIGRCGVAHRLRCYEDYCTCALASSALLSAVSLARAQFGGKRAQALFAGMATHSLGAFIGGSSLSRR